MITPILIVAPPGTWGLDPVHSRVDFEVSRLAVDPEVGAVDGHGQIEADAER